MKVFFVLFLFFLAACKTREDIKREKLVSNLAFQMKDGQKLQSDFTSRIQALEEQFNQISGKVEEERHRVGQAIQGRSKRLDERISVLETIVESSDKKLALIEKKLSQQDKYLKNVLKTLKSFSHGQKASNRKKTHSLYSKAMKNYKAAKYKTAKKQLMTLLKKSGLKSSQKARILHNLGMISHIGKRPNEAIVYFGRLFTQYPKSTYNKNGLLFTAKSFIQQKKLDEARQTLNELKRRFPKGNHIKEATKLLRSL